MIQGLAPIYADALEVRDSEFVAIYTGNLLSV
jgi:hypothetical protein